MKTNLLLPSSVCGAIAALLLVACGRPETKPATAVAPVASVASSPGQPGEARAILITASDTMKFSAVEIRATPGEALAVTLRNDGTMPKFSMGHNWVLLTSGVDLNEFAGEASMAAKTDFVPAAKRQHVLAATKLLGPRESDTARFSAPKAPGRYPYLCTFPGHLQVGMKGELVVE